MADKPNPLVDVWAREIGGMRAKANRRLAAVDLTLDENDNIVPMGDVTVHCPCGSSILVSAHELKAWVAEHHSHLGDRVSVTETWHLP